MDLSWDHFNSSLPDKTRNSFGCAGFQEKFDTPTKTDPSFGKLNSPPTKLCNMLFPTHLQARELCPQTYRPCHCLLLEWSHVTHIPARIKSGGVYKPEKSAFYSTFARKLCDDTRLPGWLSAFPVHPHSSPLRQALHTQIANRHIQQARKSF